MCTVSRHTSGVLVGRGRLERVHRAFLRTDNSQSDGPKLRDCNSDVSKGERWLGRINARVVCGAALRKQSRTYVFVPMKLLSTFHFPSRPAAAPRSRVWCVCRDFPKGHAADHQYCLYLLDLWVATDTHTVPFDRSIRSVRLVFLSGHVVVASMSFLRDLKSLYSLDTLDTRLTSSSRTPHKSTEASIAEAKLPAQNVLHKGDQNKLPHAQPSRWNTPEFYFYYFIFLTIPFFMVKSVYDVSKGISLPVALFTSV